MISFKHPNPSGKYFYLHSIDKKASVSKDLNNSLQGTQIQRKIPHTLEAHDCSRRHMKGSLQSPEEKGHDGKSWEKCFRGGQIAG